jgi:hypothetical protein
MSYWGFLICTATRISYLPFLFAPEERQISVPVEVTCSLDGNTVVVGAALVDVVGDVVGDVTGLLGDVLGDLGLWVPVHDIISIIRY